MINFVGTQVTKYSRFCWGLLVKSVWKMLLCVLYCACLIEKLNPLSYMLTSLRFSLLFLGVLFTTHLQAQTSNPAKIREAYQRFVESPQLENGSVSLSVMNASTGEMLVSGNGKTGLATASTLKNITAATAFQILGPDFTFQTVVSRAGSIDPAGVLKGNLIILGSGDPTLGSSRYDHTKEDVLLEKWVQAVKAAGIRKIEGNIIGDDLLHGGYQAPNGWPWADMGNYYGAGYSSLNWRENAFGVVFQTGSQAGLPTSIGSMTADLSYLNIINEVTTGNPGSGDNVYGYSAPYSSKIFFRGSHGVDLKKTIQMSVPDPAYDLAYQFLQMLKRSGIEVTGVPETTYGMKNRQQAYEVMDEHVLDVHHSPILSDIIYNFNQVSINLYGESLLKAIAQQLGESTETGAVGRWVGDYWSDKLDIARGELRIVDGSGLSPNNRVTTSAMVKILAFCREQPWFDAFLASIPTNNGMKLKSGTISGVLGYAGYHTASDGSQYIVALLVNNYGGGASAMRRQMFSMLDVLK